MQVSAEKAPRAYAEGTGFRCDAYFEKPVGEYHDADGDEDNRYDLRRPQKDYQAEHGEKDAEFKVELKREAEKIL